MTVVEKTPGRKGRFYFFATGPGGVYVITPKGKLLGRVHTGKATSNCAWGSDGSVLYMTVDDCLCRLKTKTKGAYTKSLGISP